MMKYKRYKSVLKMKIDVIRKILRSDYFAFLSFEKDGKTGYVELHTTPGFFKSQQDRLICIGQVILREQMEIDSLEENVVSEAKQILNSNKA